MGIIYCSTNQVEGGYVFVPVCVSDIKMSKSYKWILTLKVLNF